LLTTAHLAELSSSHRVGACNVLCGVIEQCVDSNEDEVRSLAFSRATIGRLFDVYLDRYDSGKSKAMKQVLNTLVRLLARTSDRDQVQSACSRCLDLAFVKRDRRKTKPALHALTVFLSRKVLEIPQLVACYAGLKSSNMSSRTVSRNGRNLEMESSHSDLVGDLLYWVPTTDIAPAVGPLLSAICKQEDGVENAGQTGLPIWAEPVVSGMMSNPSEIQSYRHHAFPALLQSGLQGYLRFLEYLGLREQLALPSESNGASRVVPESVAQTGEIRESMLFAALQAGKSCGMIEECSTLLS
jgi:hypothetical protein